MARTVALDRIALGLLALANWLLVAGVLAVFLVMQRPAAAEEAACGGENLLAAMERDDPAQVAALKAEAAATPNGEGLLWRIETEGAPPSWLFGTMHMTDPRVVSLPERASEAFDQARLVVIETTDILDPAKMTAAMMAQPELMMFTGSETLSSLIAEEDHAMVSKALAERGIPLATVEKMKPWIIAALVALPACELARKAAGGDVLDEQLAADAMAAGKELAGLETAVSQLEAMASLPMSLHIDGLVETLRLGDRMDDVMETMIQLYLAGETGLFWPFFHAVLPESDDETGAYADFQETMVVARNRGMAESAMPMIREGGAFIAVGALHLPGPEGLVALLRDSGLTVEPVR
ncbi:MAG: TraB/GumN family protein [Rhizobiaceae bacterium]|nr:TraB/GumN family protein [Rhizobiaceae bacterium]